MPIIVQHEPQGPRINSRTLGRQVAAWRASTEDSTPYNVVKREKDKTKEHGKGDDIEKEEEEDEDEIELLVDDDNDDDDDNDEEDGDGVQQGTGQTSPSTATLPSAASQSSQPTVTGSSDSGGLSEGTEHLLIAAGSIVGTLLLLTIAFITYRVRRGTPASQVFKFKSTRRLQSDREQLPSQEETNNGSQFKGFGDVKPSDSAPITQAVDFGNSKQEKALSPPKPALSRDRNGAPMKTLGDTLSSQRKTKPNSPPQKQDLPLRKLSDDNSKNLLKAPDDIHRQDSHHKHKSSYHFPDELTPMPHASFMLGPRPKDDLDNSRFSWSTYRDASPLPNDPRISAAPSTASTIPRFRTVDSWVQSQQGRYEAQHNGHEQVPEVPSQYQQPGQDRQPMRSTELLDNYI